MSPILYCLHLLTFLQFQTSCQEALFVNTILFIILDFDPDSLAKVLELINTGSTMLSIADQTFYQGMIDIIQCLQINIKLKFSKCATNNPEQSGDTLNNNGSRTEVLQNLSKPDITITEDDIEILDMTENNNSTSSDHNSAFFEMEKENKKEKKGSHILPYRYNKTQYLNAI